MTPELLPFQITGIKNCSVSFDGSSFECQRGGKKSLPMIAQKNLVQAVSCLKSSSSHSNIYSVIQSVSKRQFVQSRKLPEK